MSHKGQHCAGQKRQRIAVLALLKRALTARDADDILNEGGNYFSHQCLENCG